MSLRVWRLTKPRHGRRAFDGEGARAHGGRWNSPGTRVVYASDSIALAALELLVHLESPAILATYWLFEATFDEALLERRELADLPAGWRESPAPAAARAVGDEWVAAGRSVALRLPSVHVPEEGNVLLNPEHPRFARVRRRRVRTFRFDPRVARTS